MTKILGKGASYGDIGGEGVRFMEKFKLDSWIPWMMTFRTSLAAILDSDTKNSVLQNTIVCSCFFVCKIEKNILD